MSRIAIDRNKARLRGILGIRGRLVLLALILVGPLMIERIRSLEDTRAQQIAATSRDLSMLAQHAADAQKEIISSVEAVLKSSAYIHAAAEQIGQSCAILRSSMRVDLPSIRRLSIVDADGLVHCSTEPVMVGQNLANRAYFKKAQDVRGFVLSDYLFSKANSEPTIVAAYAVSAVTGATDAVIVASINLEWLSNVMSNMGGRAGVSAALVDTNGVVIATTPDQFSMVGRPLDRHVRDAALADQHNQTAMHPVVQADGTSRAVFSAPVRGTAARLVVTIDEDKVTSAINRNIRSAYMQLALVCLLVLIGALIAAERLIVMPINLMTAMTLKFGQGDWSARVDRARLPAEFTPLARAFNAMAARLGARERGLVAINNRLSVMATVDPLCGLANRRGFQSRIDFEWLKAQQTGSELALLMIDVDHFKLYNDSFGHLQGDACLTRIGETLSAIALDFKGFAARYGGEEFCLLLPDAGPDTVAEAGENVRAAIERLALPHPSSIYRTVTVSVGIARAAPGDSASPRDLIEAADAALYAAKSRGRNAVVEHGVSAIAERRLARAG